MSDVGALTVSAARPTLRHPRTIIQVNGEEMPGWLEWGTEENAFYQADTFRLVFLESELPAGRGPAWWATQKELKIEIFAGNVADPDRFTTADIESIFYGRADDLDWEPATGIIELHGRDLTGLMLDSKTDEKYPNLTASQIATKIAEAVGLTAKITKTTAKVGKYYAQDHVRLQTEQTQWDLLTWLAREEGFLVYVRGQELHFEPPPADRDPFVVEWVPPTADATASANAVQLRFTRALTLSKSIKVTVRSWNSKQKKAFTKTSTRGTAKTGGKAQQYSYTIPGLDADGAQKRADQLAKELSAHEMRVNLTGPANGDFHINRQLKVQGTGTAFDQVYYPDSISRTQTVDEGMVWAVGAKNHSPESESNL